MSQTEQKREAARAALGHVENGMRLGIGTGTTAEEFVKLLAEQVADGFQIIGVPTSERTAALCMQLNVPLSTLDDTPELDLTIDGADEIDPALNLIKGAGGALLREKIVADASARMIVIADESKVVRALGAFALPIEVNPFGLTVTQRAIERKCEEIGLSGALKQRRNGDGSAFVTDGGHFIVDASFGHISDPQTLSHTLNAIPGVVEHGLFISMAERALIAGAEGTRELLPET